MKNIIILIAMISSVYAENWHFASFGDKKCQKLDGVTPLQITFIYGCNANYGEQENRKNMVKKGMYIFDCHDRGLLVFGADEITCNKMLESK